MCIKYDTIIRIISIRFFDWFDLRNFFMSKVIKWVYMAFKFIEISSQLKLIN